MRVGAGAEAVMEGGQHRPPALSPTLHTGGSTKSPPLSAAPSQASLSCSDPDLARTSLASSSVSLSSTSRPPSSSSGLVSPDLAPHPVTDITDAVEEEGEEGKQPPTPRPLLSNGAVGGAALPVAGRMDRTGTRPLHLLPAADDNFLCPDLTNGDGPTSDVEEDYFEEYHLPNTHENAFVRHRSFRRKVELTPINAPDAERIEGLVRTGELERHGSMRRKIVAGGAEAGLYKLDEDREARPRKPRPPVQEFGEDFREIEQMMDDTGLGDAEGSHDYGKGAAEHDEDIRAEVDTRPPFGETGSKDTPKLLLMRGKNVYTSTPNPVYASTADYASVDLSASLHENSSGAREHTEDGSHELESLSIEQSTLTKVRECMDFSKCKDIYSLTGKLQDMLTAVEVEEVLNNSHRYVDYIDTGVLEALFNSISEQMSITGQPMSISFNKSNHSNKGVKEEKELSQEEVELQNKIKQKLLMEELAMDSLPYISVQPEGEFPPTEDVVPVVMRKKSDTHNGGDGDTACYGTIERRKSVRVSAGKTQVEVEGVFIESDFKNSKMKTIPAPTIDLINSGSQDDFDIPDLDVSPASLNDAVAGVSDHDLHPYGAEGASDMYGVPSIRITRTESSREEEDEEELPDRGEDNSSVNNLYLCDESSLHEGDSEYSVCRPSADCSSGGVQLVDDALCHASSPQHEHDPVSFPAVAEGGPEEHWRTVVIGGVWRRIDMQVIAPYRKCISPGGQHGGHTVVVVSACQLPARARPDYAYVMDNLFLYLLCRLEQLVSEDYLLVYLCGGRQTAQTGPGFHWLKAAYRMIDRKLRKNLQALLVVHPSLWVRTVVALTRPFISSKFYRKLTFVYSLTELAQLIPLDQLQIPDSVKEADFELMIREKKRNIPRRPRPPAFNK